MGIDRLPRIQHDTIRRLLLNAQATLPASSQLQWPGSKALQHMRKFNLGNTAFLPIQTIRVKKNVCETK